MIWALFKMVPMRAWIYGAIAVMVVGVLTGLHLQLENKALAKQAAHHAIELRELRDSYQKQIQDAHDVAQKTLNKVNDDWKAAFARHQVEDAQLAAQRQKQITTLKEGFDRYVTPAQLHRCPDVPRGYLVRRADAASYANGAAEAAGPPPQAGELDQPSGVPFAALWPIDVDAAGAYRECRARVAEWERWGGDVDRWREQVQSALDAKP